MNEVFLYFIWQNRLYGKASCHALTGESIEIVNPGIRNKESGPDFFDARVKINGILWAGNVEIHVKASDWIQHGHNNDAAYKNVILHVVYEYDCNIEGPSGTAIPVLQLDFSKELLTRYNKLIENNSPIHCSGDTEKGEPFRTMAFLHSIALERLSEKSESIHKLLKQNGNNWEEAFYLTLARNFGFHINALPFEMLARSVPLKAIVRHRNSLLQIEALLFGQAGLLGKNEINDEYFFRLKSEYEMLAGKFKLQPINTAAWKFSPVRPGNLPTIRIAQFAALVYHSFPLFSRMIENESPEETDAMFRVEPSEYWKTHFSFQTQSSELVKKMGRNSFHLIVINTVAPFLYLYGLVKDDEKYAQRAVDLLESIPPEQNYIVALWKKEGINAESALETQAMIQLFRNYCSKKRCVECTIGAMIITQKN